MPDWWHRQLTLHWFVLRARDKWPNGIWIWPLETVEKKWTCLPKVLTHIDAHAHGPPLWTQEPSSLTRRKTSLISDLPLLSVCCRFLRYFDVLYFGPSCYDDGSAPKQKLIHITAITGTVTFVPWITMELRGSPEWVWEHSPGESTCCVRGVDWVTVLVSGMSLASFPLSVKMDKLNNSGETGKQSTLTTIDTYTHALAHPHTHTLTHTHTHTHTHKHSETHWHTYTPHTHTL